MTKTYLKELVYQVNGCAIEVHKHLGPGLLESVYHNCLKKELTIRGIDFQTELIIPVNYKGLEVEAGLRCDLFIEKSLVIELKAVEKVLPIHEAQLLTYMKLLEVPMGLIINFNVTHIFKEGQKSYVNELYRYLEEE
ncbi:GxxExxY protein [Flavobacterium aquicola]|uniref:GxxExxY protein n=1 Tax=Flavobacterium aquicola TaxID=1682742 RepID=A0A3E0ENQ6_9FLAO|nr:GxxExxY protein [Flavobacterium aquicola]REG98979.1 GxxExxY protein [Flavobacterium aquicola]